MRQLSAGLETAMMLLKQLVKKEITHHHHATKTIWIATALFLIVCLILWDGIVHIRTWKCIKPVTQNIVM